MGIKEKLEGMKKDFKMMAAVKDPESGKSFFIALGLDEDSAKEIIEAFKRMKDNQEVVENTYERAISSKSGVDFSTDISKNQQRLFDSEQYFESVINKYALLSVANSPNLESSQIDKEFLDMLSEEGIKEEQITNQGLRTAFHYYNENKEKDNMVKGLKSENSTLKFELREANEENSKLKVAYKKLQDKFRHRIASDEKHYQAALGEIATLKGKINELQNKGILKTIGSKLTGIFKSKREGLPESSSEIPGTLCSGAEKMGLTEPGEGEISFLDRDNDTRTQVSQKNNDGWQH